MCRMRCGRVDLVVDPETCLRFSVLSIGGVGIVRPLHMRAVRRCYLPTFRNCVQGVCAEVEERQRERERQDFDGLLWPTGCGRKAFQERNKVGEASVK